MNTIWKVTYVHPTEDRIGNDKFYYRPSAIAYARNLKRIGYRNIHIQKTDEPV